MRFKHPLIGATLAVFASLLYVIFCSSSSFAQKDSFGKPDTCRIIVFQEEKSNQVMASVSVFNDEGLAAMTLPFRYGDGKSPIKCDSIKFWDTRTMFFDMKTELIDTVRQAVLIGLIADMSGQKPPMKKGDGEVAKIYFTIPKGAKFQDFYMDTTWFKPMNVLKFVTPEVKSVYPAFDNSKALIRGGIPLPPPPKKQKESETEKASGPEKEGKN
ncbi:MAG: hypothetical protein WBC77_03900 [Candidatus Zixiibacteriota bacterium]